MAWALSEQHVKGFREDWDRSDAHSSWVGTYGTKRTNVINHNLQTISFTADDVKLCLQLAQCLLANCQDVPQSTLLKLAVSTISCSANKHLDSRIASDRWDTAAQQLAGILRGQGCKNASRQVLQVKAYEQQVAIADELVQLVRTALLEASFCPHKEECNEEGCNEEGGNVTGQGCRAGAHARSWMRQILNEPTNPGAAAGTTDAAQNDDTALTADDVDVTVAVPTAASPGKHLSTGADRDLQQHDQQQHCTRGAGRRHRMQVLHGQADDDDDDDDVAAAAAGTNASIHASTLQSMLQAGQSGRALMHRTVTQCLTIMNATYRAKAIQECKSQLKQIATDKDMLQELLQHLAQLDALANSLVAVANQTSLRDLTNVAKYCRQLEVLSGLPLLEPDSYTCADQALGAGASGKVELLIDSVTGEKVAAKRMLLTHYKHSNNSHKGRLSQLTGPLANMELTSARDAAAEVVSLQHAAFSSRGRVLQPRGFWVATVRDGAEVGVVLTVVLPLGVDLWTAKLRMLGKPGGEFDGLSQPDKQLVLECVAWGGMGSIAAALHAFHDSLHLHRDLKLQNVVIQGLSTSPSLKERVRVCCTPRVSSMSARSSNVSPAA